MSFKPLSKMAGIPNIIKFWTYRRKSEPNSEGFYELQYVDVTKRIMATNSSDSLWFEHPTLGPRVDIGVIDVTEEVHGLDIACVNEIESDAVLEEYASQEAFVIGFPFGQIAGAPAPVWKRATIALDPSFDIEGLPKLLVDTATREGMSGSVVVARKVVLGQDYPKKDGTRSEAVLYAALTVVIGIYSGRCYPDLEKAQLGVVWKRTAIEDTVANGTAHRQT